MTTYHFLSSISKRNQYILVLAAGSILRFIIFFTTALPAVLERRPELTTPLTSFRSLKEGVFIYELGTNPYNGGVLYHSPIYLSFFTYLIPISSYFLTTLFWILSDVFSALALGQIWRTRIERSGVKSGDDGREAIVAALYLFNPYTLFSCLARSTTSLDNTLLLLTISLASTGQTAFSLLALAVATHTSLYPILLLPPLIMLSRNPSFTSKSPNSTSSIKPFVQIFLFLLYLSGLTLFNWSLVGWTWISRTCGIILTVSDLTPNVGMWWYFFTEMFDHFRNFFLGVFQLHIIIYVTPICLRFHSDPQLAILLLLGIIGTWKSYPTLGDTALWVGLLGCFPEIASNLRHPLFSLTVSLYTLILLPLLHSLWLLTGTGNANFFYAATMVHGLSLGLAVADMTVAGIKVEVKRKVSKELNWDIVTDGGDTVIEGEDRKHDTGEEDLSHYATSMPDTGRWDREKVEKMWKEKGWEVVQFSGLAD